MRFVGHLWNSCIATLCLNHRHFLHCSPAGHTNKLIIYHKSQRTMLLVANNAAQGVLSSFFFKFADTILKKYSSTVATIFTGLVSAFLFGHQITINFCIGVSIVLISMHLFFSSSEQLSKAKFNSLGGLNEENSSLSNEERSRRANRFIVSPSMEHLSAYQSAQNLKDVGLSASIAENRVWLRVIII